MNHLSLLVVSALMLSACGDDDAACTPGAVVVCACPSGDGEQTCRADGSLGSCLCEALDAGGLSDTDGADSGSDAGADAGSDAGGPDVPVPDVPVVVMDDNCDDGTCVFVSRMFDISPVGAEGQVYGENLDDEVTGSGDPTGCGKNDFRSALDATNGIDNAIVNLRPVIDSMAIVSISTTYANALVAGELLMVIKLEDVDGADDEDVDVSVWYGMIVGTPTFDDEGLVGGGQTIAAISEVSVTTGTITAGRFRAVFPELSFSIGLLSNLAFLPLTDARVSATIDDSTLVEGIIAGSLDVEELTVAMATSPDISVTQARNLLDAFADTGPVEGMCEALSVGAIFESVHAREE